MYVKCCSLRGKNVIRKSQHAYLRDDFILFEQGGYLSLKKQFPVLIAEDDPVSRMLLEKTLVKAGYEVAVVKNGHEALESFSKKFYPIVLTDWMMPRMDGLQLCRAIRKNISTGYVFILYSQPRTL